jgi:ribosomal protein L7/L12
MSNQHIQALRILQDVVEGRKEAMSLLFEVARQCPEALINASNGDALQHWSESVTTALHHLDRVGAVKITRSALSLSLIEAKNLCEAADLLVTAGDITAARKLLEGKQ